MIPLGCQNQCIHSLHHIVGVLPILYLRKDCFGFLHGCWIEGLHFGSHVQKSLDDYNRRGFPDVIRVGLEGEAQNPNGLALKIPYLLHNLTDHPLFLFLVYPDDSVENFERISSLMSHPRKGSGVLWKTGASITWTRVEKFFSNPSIQSHGPRHMKDIGAHYFTEVGNLIDKAHFRR